MNSRDSNKKFKRPRQKTQSTTNPEVSKSRIYSDPEEHEPSEPLCPLLAKDSEWVDILQSPMTSAGQSSKHVSDEEAVLQLVECEDGPQMKPLAIMFPGLLERDPLTLEGMLAKTMSTTEVTKHLVDLGQKANFTFMKKASRLIPPERQWLESVTESSTNSCGSTDSVSATYNSCILSDYDADSEFVDHDVLRINRKRKKKLLNPVSQENAHSQNTLTDIDNLTEITPSKTVASAFKEFKE